jgi:hypothetical protein
VHIHNKISSGQTFTTDIPQIVGSTKAHTVVIFELRKGIFYNQTAQNEENKELFHGLI